MIWINVTTSLGWGRPYVGIVRVEVETAIHFLENQSDKCSLCRWSDGAFFQVSSDDYLTHINNLNHGIYDRSCQLNKDDPVDFAFGDDFLSIGLDWDHGFLEYIRIKKKDCGLRVTGCCYDIIPIKFPHYCVGDVAAFFASYFIELASTADHILCISQNSMKDLEKFLLNAGAIVPPLSVFRLGDAVTKDRISPSEAWPSELNRDLGYMLIVSTIERRKNHQTAYLALRRVIEDQLLPPDQIPHLVIVGMRGWGVDDLFSDIALDPVTQGFIHVLNHVSDEELRNLYLKSRFTLYPSYYEGWGLPVCESLCYGKVVVSSGISSLPEAGGDYALYCDPYSPAEWALKIVELCRDDNLLKQLENRIQTEYIPYSWSQTAQQVIDVVCSAADHMTMQHITFEPGYDLSTLSGNHIGGWIMGDASQPGIILFGPHAKLPASNLEVQIELLFSSDFDADILIRLAASQETLASNMIKHADIPLAEPSVNANRVAGSSLIKLPTVSIYKPVSDVEVVIDLLPGQGQVYVKQVHFILNNIRQGEIVTLSKRSKSTKKSLADVNTAIRSEMLDEASLVLEDIRNNLTHKLYEMKFNEIARKRLLGKQRRLQTDSAS
jgi:glycosyltransferase involved in cell wall biosynthesis